MRVLGSPLVGGWDGVREHIRKESAVLVSWK